MNGNESMLSLAEALDRWTEQILPSKPKFIAALKRRKLTIYHGIDPTGPDLHLGHSTNFLLMRALQDAGHKVILLIGDFTGMIGDPTGKISTRKQLTRKQVLENSRTYKEQAATILKFNGPNPIEVKFNSEWLSKISLEKLFRLAALVTYQQLIERDMFQERQKKRQDIFLHEFFYPLMQGYDSAAMDVDAEIGGTDQTFNMLVGRRLMKRLKGKEKFVVTTPLLINSKTGRKLMSKSEGTYVALNDDPNEMFAKVMAFPDEALIPCFTLCTTVPTKEIQSIEQQLQSNKLKPMEVKKRLAWEIVKFYHGQKEANQAQREFEKVFQKKEAPEAVKVYKAKKDKVDLTDALTSSGLAKSKSEVRRLIQQGALEWNGEKVSEQFLNITKAGILKVGKYRFLRIEK